MAQRSKSAIRRFLGDMYFRSVSRTRAVKASAAQLPLRLERWRAERLLASRRLPPVPEARFGRVLVDGMWDNPNYWMRVWLLRETLGLDRAELTGLTGPHNAERVTGTFAKLGVSALRSLPDLLPAAKPEAEALAGQLMATATGPDDILGWALPFDFPTINLYDHLLKQQKLASIDLNHPQFRQHLEEALCLVLAAGRLLDELRPDLVIISHVIGVQYGAIAWIALGRGVPVLLPQGISGATRARMITSTAEMHDLRDGPTAEEMAAMPPERARAFEELGRRYLALRRSGQTTDVSARYAYTAASMPSRSEICAQFGWSEDRPLIAVYSPSWLDYIHTFGPAPFRDGRDWLDAVLATAMATTGFNWLLKPHPLESWYGSERLSGMVGDVGGHVGIVPAHWNNAAIQAGADAFVTWQSTVGVEVTCLGKPAIVCSRGWYGDAGFTRLVTDRQGYLDALRSRWWEGMDLAENRRKAELFLGWFFCGPGWRDGTALADDTEPYLEQWRVVRHCLLRQMPGLSRERESLLDWLRTGTRFHHTHLMKTEPAEALATISDLQGRTRNRLGLARRS